MKKIVYAALIILLSISAATYATSLERHGDVEDILKRIKLLSTDDLTYGYSKHNPIKLGTPTHSPLGERVYLFKLRDKNFLPFKFFRLGNVGVGIDGHVIDLYKIIDSDGKEYELYIDMYHPELCEITFEHYQPTIRPEGCIAPNGLAIYDDKILRELNSLPKKSLNLLTQIENKSAIVSSYLKGLRRCQKDAASLHMSFDVFLTLYNNYMCALTEYYKNSHWNDEIDELALQVGVLTQDEINIGKTELHQAVLNRVKMNVTIRAERAKSMGLQK